MDLHGLSRTLEKILKNYNAPGRVTRSLPMRGR